MIKFNKLFAPNENLSFRAVIFLSSQLITQLIGVIFSSLLTKILSVEDFGMLALYTTYMSVVSIVVGLQCHGSLNIALVSYSNKQYKKYVSSILFLSLLFFILIFSVFIIFISPISKILNFNKIVVFLLVPHAFASFCVNFFSAYLKIEKKAVLYTLINIGLTSLVWGISIFLVLKMTSNQYLGKIWGTSVPYILAGTAIILVMFIRGKTFFNKSYWSFCLPLCAPLIFESLSSTVLAQSDRIMLGWLSGESSVGIYSFCYMMAVPVNAVWLSLNSSWSPQYYEYMKNKDLATLKKHAQGYNFSFTSLSMGFMLVCPETIKVLAPESYWGGIYVIPLVVLAYYFTFLYSFPANHEFYHKKTVYISLATAFAAIINVILNFILIPRFGIIGAAIATLISFIVMFLFHEMVARFVVKEYNYYGVWFYLKGLIPMLIATALTFLFIDAWIVRWLMGAIVGACLIGKTIKYKSIF